MQIGDWMTLDEAAKQLGVGYWALYKYTKRAKIPTKRVGRSLLVRLEDIRPAVVYPVATKLGLKGGVQPRPMLRESRTPSRGDMVMPFMGVVLEYLSPEQLDRLEQRIESKRQR
jgi:excisionase family DNA binding protein